MDATVVIADDHEILRHGIAEHILPAAGMRALAQVPDAGSALAAVAAHKPDILLLDLEMPGRDSLGIIPEVRSLSPHTRVVIFSGFCPEPLVTRALRLRVSGYIVKTEPLEAVAGALRQIMAGRSYFSPSVRIKPQSEDLLASGVQQETLVESLTPRELEVLRYIGRGLDNASMAKVMHLSKRTVERHVSRLMRSLQVYNRTHLIRLAMQARVVPVEQMLAT